MTYISVIQILLSVALIVTILLQRSEAGLGGSLGGDLGSASHHTRRGPEKFLFQATIVIAILFALTAIVTLIL
tara:strand:- start:1047 stop:1265 length:219 start_codon:yes stop_codon:yes gene_type:complete